MALSLTCPSCGNIITQVTRSPQMVVCNACNSTHLLTNGAMEDVGKSAILTEEPSIFEVYKRYKYKDWAFTPVGRVRYEYADGYWDEWFVRGENGKESWISVDEGDIAIETSFAKPTSLPTFEQIKVGGAMMINRVRMTVAEKNTCTCIGAQGELPFKVVPNETYDYIDLLGPKRSSFSIEFTEDGVECYKGIWVDPFEIKEA